MVQLTSSSSSQARNVATPPHVLVCFSSCMYSSSRDSTTSIAYRKIDPASYVCYFSNTCGLLAWSRKPFLSCCSPACSSLCHPSFTLAPKAGGSRVVPKFCIRMAAEKVSCWRQQ